MKKIRFSLVLIITVLLAVSQTTCGGGGGGGGQATPSPTSTPEKTISEYSSALKSGNISKALESVSQDSQERLQAALKELDNDFREKLANAILNSTKAYESETMIFYKVTMTSTDGRIIEDTIRLIKENGVWKISGL